MCAQAIHDGPASNHTGARFQFRSPLDARGYARMDAVIEDTDLDIAVRFTYLIVKQQAWSGPDAALTTDDIARILGRSPGQAYRYLQELVEAGLLSIESKPFDGQPDIYVMRTRNIPGPDIADLLLLREGTYREYTSIELPTVPGTVRDDEVYPIDYDRDGKSEFLVLHGHSLHPAPIQLITVS